MFDGASSALSQIEKLVAVSDDVALPDEDVDGGGDDWPVDDAVVDAPLHPIDAPSAVSPPVAAARTTGVQSSSSRPLERAERVLSCRGMTQPQHISGITLPPGADELPCCDGEPMESERHRKQMNLLIDSIEYAWAARDDFYVGGNMFVYFSVLQVKRNDFRGPDVFVVQGVPRRERKSWVVWEEDGRTPDVVIELLSDSTRDADRGPKKRIYERVLKVHEYFLYDPFTHELEGFQLDAGGHYQPIELNVRQRLPSAQLALELGVGHGRYQGVEADWLRLFDHAGALVLTGAEAEAQRAEAEAQRAEAEAQRAEAEAQRAEDLSARLRAYEERFGPLDREGAKDE